MNPALSGEGHGTPNKETTMSGLMGRITRLARSPQGRRIADRAQSYARSPEGRRKIAEVRGRLGKRGGGRP